MATPREKVVAEIGVSEAKFAPKVAGAYVTPISVKYAIGIVLDPTVERVERYADNRLVLGIPNEQGMEGTLGTTARDVELEKVTGTAMEVTGGVATLQQKTYARGAVYFEHEEVDEDNVIKKVKTWCFDAELGRGGVNHSTKTGTLAFADYTYPLRVLGETLMKSDGASEYVDENGMGRVAYMVSAWPGDTGYATFGDEVPTPKALVGA